ncbi:hypothetical protein TNCV_2133171 [Trichonephila clavipes]|nr:hypothetical protein TNCV_2133171 [Trichonephila clavipes]
MALMDRAATSRALSQELGSFARQEMSARTINPGSVYSIKMIASVFVSIVVSAHWQRAFVFVILVHYLALWTFLDTENVRLLPCPTHSLDRSPIVNVQSMVAERLSRHNRAATTDDELWHRVEATWSSVPVHAIQSLFDSMCRRISAVIIA